jgi:hypothetical protein
MVIFNIIHPSKYLIADPAVPTKNSSTSNGARVNGVSVVVK